MMLIYHVKNGYLAEQVELAEGEPIPPNWTCREPPLLLDGQYAMWVGEWAVTSVAPLPPEPAHNPATERIFLLGQQWEVLAVPSAEPAAPAEPEQVI